MGRERAARRLRVHRLRLALVLQARSTKARRKRDRHAAKRILELQREWDENGSLVYVIYGEAHLSRPHLPKVLKSLSSTELTVVTIFQNSEKLYFDLAKQGDDSSVEVMKGSQNRFCIMSSPPWLKWQSYLVFLEKNFDVDLDEDEDAEGDFDFTDHFEHILSFILKDLGLNLEARDFVVYTPEQDYFKMIVERHCSGEEKKIAEFLMRNDRSFYLPQSKTFYLSRLTVNHSAGLAGHYIQSQLSGRARSLWDMPKDFLALIWLEALGFFTSKLINPKRKTEQLLDLKAQLATMTPGDQGRESLLLALDQRVLEIARSERKGASRRVKVKKATSYLIAARILGHMLGDRIFRLIREKKMHRDDVLVCFQKSVLAPDFENFYLEQVHKIDQWMKELSTKELL